MPDLAVEPRGLWLLQADPNWSVPSTTRVQYIFAGTLLTVAIIATAYALWRRGVWGMEDDRAEIREEVRKQKRRQSPRMYEAPSQVLKDGSVNLVSELAALLDPGLDPEETHTTIRGAIVEFYRALSVGWHSRVDVVPAAARRLAGWAVAVTVLGAVAVSTSAVVSLLQSSPGSPSLADVLHQLQSATLFVIEGLAAYPFAGDLWALAFTAVLIVGEWLYVRWWFVAGALVKAAISLAILDRKVGADIDQQVFDSENRLLALGALVGLGAGTWIVGAAIATYGALVIDAGVAAASGLVISLLVFVVGAGAIVMYRGRHVRDQLHSIADTHPEIDPDLHHVGGYLLLDRGTSLLQALAAALAVLYAIVAVAEGKFAEVAAAVATASPSVQAGLAALAVAGIAGLAYLVADSWPDVRARIAAAIAQKTVRAKLIGQATPGLAVVFAYILAYPFSKSILFSLVVAVLVGLLARGVINLLAEASYRANGLDILKRILRPAPIYVSWLGYVLELEDRQYYVLEVNGRTLCSTDPEDVVEDAVTVGRALATHEEPPATDSEWYGRFLFDHGFVDPGEWEGKLDEKIRKEALTCLRTHGPRVTRERFDRGMNDFDEDRVIQRLTDDDMQYCITLTSQYVALERDPYEQPDQLDWPEFSPFNT